MDKTWKKIDNRDQLLNHVRYALYGDTRPLLHGFHTHCYQVLCMDKNISLDKFKRKVRNSFNGTKYAQYIKLPMYDEKMEYYYKQQLNKQVSSYSNQSNIISSGNMYYFDQLCTVRKDNIISYLVCCFLVQVCWF